MALPVLLYVGLLYDYGRFDFDLSYEYFNLETSIREYEGFAVVPFHLDVEIRKAGIQGMRNNFTRLVQALKPNFIFHVPAFFSSDYDIPLEVLGEIKNKGCIVIEFDTNSAETFENLIKPRIPYYSVFITTVPDMEKAYAQAGAKALPSTWAVSSWYDRTSISIKNIPVSFIGRPYGQRRDIIDSLQQCKTGIQVWGPGWQGRWSKQFNFIKPWRHDYIAFDQMVDILHRSEIGLNLTDSPSSTTTPQVKGRHFEIPACGACQISTATFGIERYYEPDREIIIVNSADELSQTILKLQKDPKWRDEIARNAFKRTWNEHTWEHRFQKIFEQIM